MWLFLIWEMKASNQQESYSLALHVVVQIMSLSKLCHGTGQNLCSYFFVALFTVAFNYYLVLSRSLLGPGLQRVHQPCNEPAERAVSHTAHLSQGDWAHGGHHPPQVQLHSDAAQTEHLRGRHDSALTLPWRQVCLFVSVWHYYRLCVHVCGRWLLIIVRVEVIWACWHCQPCAFQACWSLFLIRLSDVRGATSTSKLQRCWTSISTPTCLTLTPVRKQRRNWPKSVGSLCLR